MSAPSSGGTFQLPVTERFRRFKLWPKTLSLRTFCNPLYYYAKEGSSTRCDQYPAGEDTQWQHQSNKLANQRVTEAIGLEDQNIFLVSINRGSCHLYDDLLRKIPSVWKPSLLTIEVGARGFVGHSMKSCLTKLGISIRLKDKLCKTLSLVSAKCSYAIYGPRRHLFLLLQGKLVRS